MNDDTKQLVSEKIEETIKAAEETVRHPYTKKFARFGFYTKGFLFMVIGVLAIFVAIGQKGGELADPSGALTTIAEKPYGRILLIVFIVGALSHGGWNILRGVADVDNAGGGVQGIFKRSIAVGVGIFYIFLAWTAWSLIIAEKIVDQNGVVTKTMVGILLSLPLGALLVLIIGLSLIGGGIHECYSGISGKYQENFRLFPLGDNQRRFVTALGVISFAARALIMVLMGYFFITAAIKYNADEAAGLDGALAALARTSYGKTLLFVTAAGLVCHGVLSLYEAKFRRIC
jgi:hypothetical protein